MVHARARLTLRLRRVDGQLQEAALAHDVGELAKLRGGAAHFTFKLCLRQACFQCGPFRQLAANGLQIVGNALQERRSLAE
ncbi:hypothetical protein D3C73_860340 [compost metagenome]